MVAAEHPSAVRLAPLEPSTPIRRVTGVELATPVAPQKWANEWLGIAPGRPTILCGEGGSRKGWFAMALLLAGAADMPFFGHSMMRGMRAIYFDWEQTLRETKVRFQMLAKGMGVDLASIGPRINYEWMPVDSLAKPTAIDEMCRHVDGIDVAVVDSTRASTKGVKENSEEAAYAGQALTQVSEKTGTSFILIDHAGLPDRDGKRQRQHSIRGHSSKRDISSTLLVMSAEQKKPTLVTCERCQVKPQDEWAEPFQFSLKLIANGGVILETVDAELDTAPDDFEAKVIKVIQCIANCPGIAGAVAVAHNKGVRIRESEARSIIQMLEGAGKVIRVKAPGRGQGAMLYLSGQVPKPGEAPF